MNKMVLGRTDTPYYNETVAEKFSFPNQERLSVVVATILLAFAITQFIKIPEGSSYISLAGFLIPLNFNLSTIVTVAIAGMTASGTDWILRDHPELKGRSTIPHLLLPAITAWVQSVILNNVSDTPFKWVIFTFGGIFLLVVILAEYIVIFTKDFRRPIAIGILTSLLYSIILALSVALASTNQRLIISLPALGLGAFVLGLRAFQLNLPQEWPIIPSLACMLVISQLATALHYLPITPLSYGLILFGALYFMINLTINNEQGTPLTRAVIEGVIPLFIIWLVAIWIN